MPKESQLSKAKIVDALLTHEEEILSSLNRPTALVWSKVSEYLHHKISPKYVYTIVKCNRYNSHEVLNIAQQNKEIPSLESTTSEDEELCFEKHMVKVNNDDWEKIRPTKVFYRNNKFEVKLKAGWTEIINRKLSSIVSGNCIWRFKKHYISASSRPYLRIYGSCSECGAQLEMINEEGPLNEELEINVVIRNKNEQLHTNIKKRKLKGDLRATVGKELADGKLAINWQREEAYQQQKKKLPFNSRSIYNLNVLRKCKQELSDKKMNDLDKFKSPIENLLNLKYSPPYMTSIQLVSLDKFMLHYWTIEQLQLYNHYNKVESVSVLAIDAYRGVG
ncbi:uncharacterized protein LOC116182995 [Photinus pyralis]|uniref:uncharacterized protein LOC116182995 n=1 Tax=Photinus pyralis TaxID=7054 RepID=UPI001266E6BB|nr:uncharacterized protein LOC116182995 [Photinus pyralis]